MSMHLKSCLYKHSNVLMKLCTDFVFYCSRILKSKFIFIYIFPLHYSKTSVGKEMPSNRQPNPVKPQKKVSVAAAMADLRPKPDRKKRKSQRKSDTTSSRVISPQATKLNLIKFRELVDKKRKEYATVGFSPRTVLTGPMRNYFDQHSAKKLTNAERCAALVARKKERKRREEIRRKERANTQNVRRKEFEKVLDADKEKKIEAVRKNAIAKAAATRKQRKEDIANALLQKEQETQADSDSIDRAIEKTVDSDDTELDSDRLLIDEGDRGNDTDDTTIGVPKDTPPQEKGQHTPQGKGEGQEDEDDEDDENIATRLRAVELLKHPSESSVPKGKLGGKKKGRISSGVKALQEIRKQQKESDTSVFSKTGWIRFVRHITRDFTQLGATKEVRMKPEAYEALMVREYNLSLYFRFLL